MPEDKDGFSISHEIIDTHLIEKIAHKQWEKEVVQKKKKPFAVAGVLAKGYQMYHFRAEDKLDDRYERASKFYLTRR
jgi:hypothetical protein